jgi:hypothetical protein
VAFVEALVVMRWMSVGEPGPRWTRAVSVVAAPVDAAATGLRMRVFGRRPGKVGVAAVVVVIDEWGPAATAAYDDRSPLGDLGPKRAEVLVAFAVEFGDRGGGPCLRSVEAAGIIQVLVFGKELQESAAGVDVEDPRACVGGKPQQVGQPERRDVERDRMVSKPGYLCRCGRLG